MQWMQTWCRKKVPKSEYADEPATDALEVLNQESAEETDGPVNEKTEETAQGKYDATKGATCNYSSAEPGIIGRRKKKLL